MKIRPMEHRPVQGTETDKNLVPVEGIMTDRPITADELLTCEEAADVLRISKKHLWTLRKDCKIQYIQDGRRIWFRRSFLEDYLDRHQRNNNR